VTQLAIDDQRPDAIQRRFEAFHAANPHVYRLIVHRAREARAAGVQRVGMAAIFERIRWDRMISTGGHGIPFKLNDHFTSRYARLVMEQEPDLDGLFEVRELRPPVPRSLAAP